MYIIIDFLLLIIIAQCAKYSTDNFRYRICKQTNNVFVMIKINKSKEKTDISEKTEMSVLCYSLNIIMF